MNVEVMSQKILRVEKRILTMCTDGFQDKYKPSSSTDVFLDRCKPSFSTDSFQDRCKSSSSIDGFQDRCKPSSGTFKQVVILFIIDSFKLTLKRIYVHL